MSVLGATDQILTILVMQVCKDVATICPGQNCPVNNVPATVTKHTFVKVTLTQDSLIGS